VTAVDLLCGDDPLATEWTVAGGELVVDLPEEPVDRTREAAYCLRIRAAPEGETAMDRATVQPDVVTSTAEMRALASDDYDPSDPDGSRSVTRGYACSGPVSVVRRPSRGTRVP
jgi:hypothetical protein